MYVLYWGDPTAKGPLNLCFDLWEYIPQDIHYEFVNDSRWIVPGTLNPLGD